MLNFSSFFLSLRSYFLTAKNNETLAIQTWFLFAIGKFACPSITGTREETNDCTTGTGFSTNDF